MQVLEFAGYQMTKSSDEHGPTLWLIPSGIEELNNQAG